MHLCCVVLIFILLGEGAFFQFARVKRICAAVGLVSR